MPDIEPAVPTRLRDANLEPRGPVYPSPSDWRDQTFYFLLPDRFSDGGEDARPLFDRAQPGQHRAPDRQRWLEGGGVFQGGTLRGIRSKLPYLRDLGVTALWIGPVWKQRSDLQTYHGYGIQNFLDVDPRFGTRQDLRDLVDAAHAEGMYVMLDVIYNHSGNNFFYDSNGRPVNDLDYRPKPFPPEPAHPYPIHGWRDAAGRSSSGEPPGLDDAVWPEEFRNPQWYTRAGKIGRWDADEGWEDPNHDDTEFRRGDFFDLKDFDHTNGTSLSALVQVYQYWIALSDCDAFRIDTVKHVSLQASRSFCGAIHEYAESIGKENFLLVGEVTGGSRMQRNYLDVFGRNIDAVLDIGAPAADLTSMVKGFSAPAAFFRNYEGHDAIGSHRETGRYHVSILDDHDMVGRVKARFSAGNTAPSRYDQVAHAVGTQLTTLGMPCIYYGTEQAFDGSALNDDDRFIREAMFGGTFGAFGTSGCHFFDPAHPSYLRIAAIARVRNRRDNIGLTLRRGRQYPRPISRDGSGFGLPGAGELCAWSRILRDREVLVVVNTNGGAAGSGFITVHAPFHQKPEARMAYLYRSDWTDAQLTAATPPAQHEPVRFATDGRATVQVALPPAGMAILA
ncbi:MAG TPA: alpha-amylase family glycosyl hydrolase [Thermoanaerobaculia bacterium]|jgi:glycosidase